MKVKGIKKSKIICQLMHPIHPISISWSYQFVQNNELFFYLNVLAYTFQKLLDFFYFIDPLLLEILMSH